MSELDFNHIIVEPDQEKLLRMFVEAFRSLPVYWPDVEALANENLLSLRQSNHYTFDITPLGFRYYAFLMQRLGEPCARIEDTIQTFLEAGLLQRLCPSAYDKWVKAEQALWAEDAERHLSEIGHHCRETIQEFATALVNRFRPSEIDADVTHTVSRIRTVLNSKRNELGKGKHAFLDALLAYWGTVSDLIQRQEHGSHKEGEPLVWDDGRRVVFQTAILMFEMSSTLFRRV